MESQFQPGPLLQWLKQHGPTAKPVMPTLATRTIVHLDLSGKNPLFDTVELDNTAALHDLVWSEMSRLRGDAGVGGYDEDRSWYQRSKIFAGSGDVRAIHLGVDIWVEAGESVCAPLDGRVHSFNDNANFGDYGPTIILEHDYEGAKGPDVFYTLYGHLSRESLPGLFDGKVIKAGEKIASIGAPPINGDWPPHLHFQIIGDMLGRRADYAGVASRADRDFYLRICPDPNLLLNLKQLA